MGTFHQGKTELHGFTVVVDTPGPEVFIGRCDDLTEQGIILNDVDVHREGEGGLSKGEYIRRAARVGVHKKHNRLSIPGTAILSVQRLGDIPTG